MLVKTTFTLAMALTLGLTSAALAARSGGSVVAPGSWDRRASQ
jgi:hypothetical protein